jgi:hypothetical protein
VGKDVRAVEGAHASMSFMDKRKMLVR